MITISGLPGSGTSTAAKLLAEKTGMEVLSSGEEFRRMAKEIGVDLGEFGKIAESDPGIDRKLDKRLIRKAEPGMILEGRLTGKLMDISEKNAYKVWLEASLMTRVKRVADREGEDESVVRKKILEREKSESTRYMDYYGIDLMDKSIYDLVVDSEENGPEEVVDKIMKGVRHESD